MKDEARRSIVAANGGYECPDCLSWITNSDAARKFHANRCTGEAAMTKYEGHTTPNG